MLLVTISLLMIVQLCWLFWKWATQMWGQNDFLRGHKGWHVYSCRSIYWWLYFMRMSEYWLVTDVLQHSGRLVTGCVSIHCWFFCYILIYLSLWTYSLRTGMCQILIKSVSVVTGVLHCGGELNNKRASINCWLFYREMRRCLLLTGVWWCSGRVVNGCAAVFQQLTPRGAGIPHPQSAG